MLLRAIDECLVQEFPGRRPIEVSHAHGGNGTGFEVSDVHADPAVFLHMHRLPVRDAPTRRASDELQALVAPGIARDASRFGMDSNVVEFVVRPKRPIATADRAVAARELTRLSRNFKADGAAVAGRGKHGCSRLYRTKSIGPLEASPGGTRDPARQRHGTHAVSARRVVQRHHRDHVRRRR